MCSRAGSRWLAALSSTLCAQAEELEAKLKHITEKIPTRIMNTSGSNAGAGSGEFHMYRMVRARAGSRAVSHWEQCSVSCSHRPGDER